MQDIIDTLGYEYKWNKEEILELYPQEIPYYYKKIAKRAKDSQEKQIRDYMMLIQTFHAENPQKVYIKLNEILETLNRESPEYLKDSQVGKPYYNIVECEKDKLEALKRSKQHYMKNKRR